MKEIAGYATLLKYIYNSDHSKIEVDIEVGSKQNNTFSRGDKIIVQFTTSNKTEPLDAFAAACRFHKYTLDGIITHKWQHFNEWNTGVRLYGEHAILFMENYAEYAYIIGGAINEVILYKQS